MISTNVLKHSDFINSILIDSFHSQQRKVSLKDNNMNICERILTKYWMLSSIWSCLLTSYNIILLQLKRAHWSKYLVQIQIQVWRKMFGQSVKVEILDFYLLANHSKLFVSKTRSPDDMWWWRTGFEKQT